MTHETDPPDLEDFFQAARAEAPVLSDNARARILNDALTLKPKARRSLFGQLGEVLGGRYGMSGLVAAGLVGVWIGAVPPSDAIDPLSLLDTQASFDLFGEDFDFSEVNDDDA